MHFSVKRRLNLWQHNFFTGKVFPTRSYLLGLGDFCGSHLVKAFVGRSSVNMVVNGLKMWRNSWIANFLLANSNGQKYVRNGLDSRTDWNPQFLKIFVVHFKRGNLINPLAPCLHGKNNVVRLFSKKSNFVHLIYYQKGLHLPAIGTRLIQFCLYWFLTKFPKNGYNPQLRQFDHRVIYLLKSCLFKSRHTFLVISDIMHSRIHMILNSAFTIHVVEKM